ncbi:MAG: propionyl-CoA carboxylase, partial [uncultured bacterium]
MNQLNKTTEDLRIKKQTILQMGGEAAIQKQHEAGKLTARERIHLLFDSGTFVEIGALGTSAAVSAEVADKNTPADAVITGWGQINGRKALVIAYDFTVIAGTIGEVGERKSARIRQIALSERIPLIWLLDSAGARIQEIASSRFAETGVMFYDQVTLS